ncbi:MAG: YihY/virulence factor BrkB family protein [Solirubrobacterales bacterium]|nr:YihY/virulence factor BrkB family protein [Solirubrobacterales bacterium]
MLPTAKRALQKFLADGMTDHAASLTYFLMMSLFPALLVGVSLLGLLGDHSLVTDAVRYARENGAPPEVTEALDASLRGTIESAGGAVSVALVIGIAVALYGAAGAFGGAGRALNAVYGVEEGRSFVRRKLSDLGCTVVVIALAAIALVCVFLGGGLADDLFGTIGLGDTAAGIWRVARWAAAIGAVLAIYAVAYAWAPDIEPRKLRWISPGALTGVLIWILASAGFFLYVANFGSYGATYGAFAGAVILLLWLYLSNIAFLFGAELNAELERAEIAGRGGPPPPSPPPSPAHPAPPGSAPEPARQS